MVPSDSRTFRLSQWITPRPMGHVAGGSPKLGPELSGESLMSVVRVGPAEVRRLGPAHRKRSRFSASCCPVRASEVRYRPASGVPEDCVLLGDVAATPPVREAGC